MAEPATVKPNRQERRHPPKIDPAVKARIDAVKHGEKPPNGMPKSPEDLPPEVLEALKQAGVDPSAASSKIVTGKRAPRYTSLEQQLAALLCLPALPCDKMGDEFCANHFATQGPLLAMQLTVYSESHKATYETLMRLCQAGGILTLSVAVGMYALPPILHHAGGPDALKRSFGVPVSVPSREEAVPDV